MAYSTAAQIRKYAERIGDQKTDTELEDYANTEDKLVIDPILQKQYNLTEIVDSDFVQELSAKCGAKTAMKALYGANPESDLKPDITKLEDDIGAILKQLRIGEIRII